ncbi:MAG: hypothetical protein KC457_29545, partial [Myxococcales bacterium]|nr:hypothetical protein [Myxococcales bacterium]
MSDSEPRRSVTVDIPRIEARPEATPMAWESLTDRQRSAAARVWALLRDMLQSKTVRSRYHRGECGQLDRIFPAIAQERHNVTIMIDGARGSGKTSLLVSLLNQWNQSARKATGARAKSEERAESFADLSDPEGRLVPIGLFDLRNLPPTTSLTMHVASLLYQLVRLAETQGGSLVDPLGPSMAKTPPARLAWQRFVQAAAALELRFQERGEHLDPETFAIELSDAEQDRLDLHERFCRLMDSLVDVWLELRP